MEKNQRKKDPKAVIPSTWRLSTKSVIYYVQKDKGAVALPSTIFHLISEKNNENHVEHAQGMYGLSRCKNKETITNAEKFSTEQTWSKVIRDAYST